MPEPFTSFSSALIPLPAETVGSLALGTQSLSGILGAAERGAGIERYHVSRTLRPGISFTRQCRRNQLQ